MMPPRFLALWGGAALLLSCTSTAPRSEAPPAQDTLTVIASRLFDSKTYETYLDSLAAPSTIRWINASDLDSVGVESALRQANGVLLTGGADIHPAHYGQDADTSRCGDIDRERDALEQQLLRGIHRFHLPTLGICRGLQHMNVFEGGSLHPHLPDVLGTQAHRAGKEGNSRDTLHVVRVLVDWEALDLRVGDSSHVVSHHHQGIDRLAPTLESWAESPDGLVEGIRHLDTEAFPCYVGVQWHPERSPRGQPLVESMGLFFVAHLKVNASEQPN
jgi:putative glutamine amidotransferase